jgi:hypothetical protein
MCASLKYVTNWYKDSTTTSITLLFKLISNALNVRTKSQSIVPIIKLSAVTSDTEGCAVVIIDLFVVGAEGVPEKNILISRIKTCKRCLRILFYHIISRWFDFRVFRAMKNARNQTLAKFNH